MFDSGMARRAAVMLATAIVLAAPAAHAQRSHFGARLGTNFDSNEMLIGAQVSIPISTQLELYPSLDVYLPDNGSLLGLNFDVKYLLGSHDVPGFYFGGGLNVLRASAGGTSNTDTGANLLFGLESRRGNVHPFGEFRVLLHDNTSTQLVVGVNFTMNRDRVRP
jgi:hypothetical protein